MQEKTKVIVKISSAIFIRLIVKYNRTLKKDKQEYHTYAKLQASNRLSKR